MVASLPTSGTELVAAAALSAGLGVLVMVVLRYEAELPYAVSLLFVPFVVAVGFSFALAVRLWLDVTMLQAAGLLGGVLLALVAGYELLRVAASDPHPPSARL